MTELCSAMAIDNGEIRWIDCIHTIILREVRDACASSFLVLGLLNTHREMNLLWKETIKIHMNVIEKKVRILGDQKSFPKSQKTSLLKPLVGQGSH